MIDVIELGEKVTLVALTLERMLGASHSGKGGGM